ncbi:MAG: hypothetical protein ACTSWY_15250 [Promethearchaeota archaeon]
MIQQSKKQIEQFVKVSFKCSVCKKIHLIKINRDLIDKASNFPVSYLYIHGNPQIYTTLYIDAKYKVRGVEVLESVGVSTNEFNDILTKSKSRTLKTIPSELIFGFQLMKGRENKKEIIKIYYKEGFEDYFNFTEISRSLAQSRLFIKDNECYNECYFRFSDYWICALQMFNRTLFMAIDSSIDIERLKTQTMAIFETIK